jgi:hypothetical protein
MNMTDQQKTKVKHNRSRKRCRESTDELQSQGSSMEDGLALLEANYRSSTNKTRRSGKQRSVEMLNMDAVLTITVV